MKNMNLIILLSSAILWFSCSINNKPDSDLQMENDTLKNQNKNTFEYLALGDSYTIGESVSEDLRFPVQLVMPTMDCIPQPQCISCGSKIFLRLQNLSSIINKNDEFNFLQHS